MAFAVPQQRFSPERVAGFQQNFPHALPLTHFLLQQSPCGYDIEILRPVPGVVQQLAGRQLIFVQAFGDRRQLLFCYFPEKGQFLQFGQYFGRVRSHASILAEFTFCQLPIAKCCWRCYNFPPQPPYAYSFRN